MESRVRSRNIASRCGVSPSGLPPGVCPAFAQREQNSRYGSYKAPTQPSAASPKRKGGRYVQAPIVNSRSQDVARPLVAAAPTLMPALVHEPSTTSRTSAEMRLGAVSVRATRKLTHYLVVTALAALPLGAQNFGEITSTVSDSTGAAVTVTRTATNQVRRAVTNDTGS